MNQRIEEGKDVQPAQADDGDGKRDRPMHPAAVGELALWGPEGGVHVACEHLHEAVWPLVRDSGAQACAAFLDATMALRDRFALAFLNPRRPKGAPVMAGRAEAVWGYDGLIWTRDGWTLEWVPGPNELNNPKATLATWRSPAGDCFDLADDGSETFLPHDTREANGDIPDDGWQDGWPEPAEAVTA